MTKVSRVAAQSAEQSGSPDTGELWRDPEFKNGKRIAVGFSLSAERDGPLIRDQNPKSAILGPLIKNQTLNPHRHDDGKVYGD